MNIKQITAEQTLMKIWNNTQLTDLQKEVVRRHYGMVKRLGRKPQSLEEVAEYMDLSLETVTALHYSALQTLKSTAKKQKITWNGVTL